LRGFDLERFGAPKSVGTVVEAELLPHVFEQTAGQIVFVDGVFQSQLSIMPKQPGVTIEHVVGKGFSPRPLPQGELQAAPMLALNGALANQGTTIRIAANTRVRNALELIWITTPDSQHHGKQPVVDVELGNHAEATVIERFIGRSDHETLTNVRVDLRVGTGAHLQHIKLQDEGAAAWHFATTVIAPAAHASVKSTVVSLGSKTARNAVHVHFDEPGAEVWLDGLFVGQSDQSLDHYTVIEHRVPRCTSHELYKGILSDKAIGSFLGRVLMNEGAVNSATDQLCRALLLSEDAKANVKPQLEIDNDDVTASHGAAIGHLDQDALFYLQARGVSAADARLLLIEGFTREVLSRLPFELEDAWITQVLDRIS
jgi:Fe-S cluster assembly protein SufD